MPAFDPLFSVADQVVFVSGGSRGIGAALAAGFAARDAKVFLASRDAESLAAAAKAMPGSKYPVEWVVCDVEKGDDIQRALKEAEERSGGLTTLLNVAGINIRKRFETYSEAEIDKIFDINLRGALLVAQKFGQLLLASKRPGNIISIDSLNSYAPLKGVIPYGITKAGVKTMTRGLATEWGPRGIRVNSIGPGFILTDLTRGLWSKPEMLAWGQANTPQGRLGEVSDLVGAALFLASPASSFMTGQTLYVDGGLTAGIHWPIPLED